MRYFVFFLTLLCGMAHASPFMATGIKIGEAQQDSAIVWVRLTAAPARVPDSAPLPQILHRNPETGAYEDTGQSKKRSWPPVVRYPAGHDVTNIAGAAPGMAGGVRVAYRGEGGDTWQETPWRRVDEDGDYIAQFKLTDLSPGTGYIVRADSRGLDGTTGATLRGGFKTAPAANMPVPVSFTVTTGQYYGHRDREDGFTIYDSMARLAPDFFVHTGDILYYDGYAKTYELALWHWQRMYSLPTNVRFHQHVASYFIKDDHDTWQNDTWPAQDNPFMGAFTFAEGLEIFRQQVPMGERTYRTARWGRDLQVWLVEGRDFRSPNDMPDGPKKTIWGAEQKRWFKETFAASDATFRILISPTPIVGPDRIRKADNHANFAFRHEGDEVRSFLAAQENAFVICGDRHWQYVSEDRQTGVVEYSCGPASDEHAGGWSNDQVLPEHRYLNVTGGFLSVHVAPDGAEAQIAFRHHDVNGKVLNEETHRATRQALSKLYTETGRARTR